MSYLFTPATQRALDEAARWTSGNDSDTLGLPEVLLGLLFEAECRAALLLENRGICPDLVRQRWPKLAKRSTGTPARSPQLALELETSFRAAESRLIEFPRPLNLATEFVLLGIAASDTEVSTWLAQHGLDADQLESEIYSLYGLKPRFDAADPTADTSSADFENLPDDNPPALQNAAGQRLTAIRTMDAAANRAREALRVVEDYTRFTLDDQHLTQFAKQLRHDLQASLNDLSGAERVLARDTQADVGTALDTLGELHRGTAQDVATANLSRLEEALRSIEEFGKLVSPTLSAAAKQLRYRAYTLERAVQITVYSTAQLARACLYVLVDGRPSLDEFDRIVTDLIEADVDVIQLREKKLPDRELLHRARRLRALTRDTATLFVMNDRPDLALLARADGVHVGQDELSLKDVRAIVGTGMFVGVSTHSIEQARQAVLDGASYIGVGPTFSSKTKLFNAYTGLELLRNVHAEIRLPAFAIGGIAPDNLAQVLSTGLSRVAVSGSIVDSSRPASVARAIKSQLVAAAP